MTIEILVFTGFAYVNTFSIKHGWGFSKATTGEFLCGRFLPLIDVATTIVPVTLIVTAVLQFSGAWLFVVIAVVTLLVELVMYIIYPRLILPLMMSFDEFPRGALHDQILEVIREYSTMNQDTIYLVEGTGDDLHSNAFVSGGIMCLSKTLLEHHEGRDDEILAIISHEIGHHVRNH